MEGLLLEGAIDLWIVPYKSTHNLPRRYRALLSPDERERADCYKFDHLSDFYTFCRGTLRRILARYSEASAEQIEFVYGNAGKPSLVDGARLEFNASHSGDLFVCAVSNGLPLGIDVEQICPLTDMSSVARNFFAPPEQTHLSSIDEKDRTQAFYECWTRKEAVIKATGEGVGRPLDSFEVAFGPGFAARLLRLDEERFPEWQMYAFEPKPGYVGAIASPHSWSTLRVYAGLED